MIPGRILSRPATRPWSSGPSFPTRCLHRFPNRATPLKSKLGIVSQRRNGIAWQSSVTGEGKSGHIVAGPNESILYFDNLFPLKVSSILGRPWQTDRDLSKLLKKFDNSSAGVLDPISLVKRAIPNSVPIKVTEIIPRLKDGGAFVKFSHPAEISATEIEGTLTKLLAEKPIKPWFSPFRSIQAGLVKGVPWLEDLYRFPNSRLKIEFTPTSPGDDGVELSQETLYSLFRRYGKIADIGSQPPDSKILPKFAHVDFVLIRDAIMARNCMHGFTVVEGLGGGKNGTKLRLTYEKRVRAHHIWNWITSHPRIVIPIVAALLAAFTVVVFDPIREFFVKAHVRQSFKLSSSRLYKWFKTQTSDILPFHHDKTEQAGLNALWNHRKDIIDDVNTWLMEATDTFIVVQGPRGSGKKELILDQVLHGRDNVLVIDCKPVVEARGEARTIKKLANQVGYSPVFSWANNISSMVDLAVQSTTGVKAGFSETLDSQVAKILQTTAAALKEVSLDGRHKDDEDAALSEDAYLEAHPEKRPVVVVDHFLHRSEDAGLIYDKVSEWAAALVQSNVAHVIFLTTDTGSSKMLSKPLPDRVFRNLALGDLSPGAAKKYVISHLDHDDQVLASDEGDAGEKEKVLSEGKYRKDLAELDGCIESLGGRLTDLNFLARRLKSGQSPKRAVDEIIEQSASDVLRMFILAKKHPSGADQKWSPEQAWYLVRKIAEAGTLRYNEVLLSSTFASSTTPEVESAESAIDSLAGAELISVGTRRGRPQTIKAGRPVYQAAFKMLLDDKALKARMDLAVLTEQAAIEAKSIEKVEAELGLLGSLPRQPYQTTDRVNYLLAKIQSSQMKIQEYDKEMAGLKKILSQEA